MLASSSSSSMAIGRSVMRSSLRTASSIPMQSSRAASTSVATASTGTGLSTGISRTRHRPAQTATVPAFRTLHSLASAPRPGAPGPLRLASPFRSSPQRRTMFIQTESTPNEDSLKFLPGTKVMESGTAEFLDTRASMASPLAKTLMQLPGVVSVFYGPNFVTVSKDPQHNWGTLKPEIYSAIMEFFTAGHALFTDPSSEQGSSDTVILDTDSEVVAMIKELLDTRVRPAIQEDGGDLEYRGYEEDGDGIVRVKLKGSCRGCDSSTVTLKSGIERMLMHYIPEVKGVEQVLDQEEEIALDEFAKLEKKLQKERQREQSMGFSV